MFPRHGHHVGQRFGGWLVEASIQPLICTSLLFLYVFKTSFSELVMSWRRPVFITRFLMRPFRYSIILNRCLSLHSALVSSALEHYKT